MDCNAAVFKSTVLPAMVAGYPVHEDTVTTQNWIEALTELAAPDPLEQPLGSGFNLYDTFYAKSLVTRDDVPLSTAAIKGYFAEVLANQGKGPTEFFGIISIYGGPGSAINAVPANTSSYSDRDSFWVIQNYGHTRNGLPLWNANITDLVDALNDVVIKAQPDGKFSSYVNYIDPGLTALRAAREYYGAVTYNKLLVLKREIDPGFVFWNPQAVGNAIAF
jgi:hypothetical protein